MQAALASSAHQVVLTPDKMYSSSFGTSPFGNFDILQISAFRNSLYQQTATTVLNSRNLKYFPIGSELLKLCRMGITQLEKSILEMYLINQEVLLKDPSAAGVFSGTDVEIVPPQTQDIKLNQITREDAILFSILFNKIKSGVTNIQVEGPDAFCENFYNSIRLLLTRPSGRLIVISILRSETVLNVIPDSTTKCSVYLNTSGSNILTSKFVLTVSSDELGYQACLNANNQIIRSKAKMHIDIGHELIHFLHNASNALGYSGFEEIKIPHWHTLEEFYTICGHELCENSLRFEFDELPRANHSASKLGPLNDNTNIHENDGTFHCSRVRSAGELGLIEEMKLLLQRGASAQEGLYGATQSDNPEIAQLCISYGARLDVPEKITLPISIAAHCESVRCLAYFVDQLKYKIPLTKDETPVPPIFTAIIANSEEALNFLLSRVNISEDEKEKLFVYTLAKNPKLLKILKEHNYKFNEDLFKANYKALLGISNGELPNSLIKYLNFTVQEAQLLTLS